MGGIINYILEHNLWFKEYALAFSNLSTIIDERFKDASELGGFFSGWDEESRSYKYDSWQYQGEVVPASLAEHHVNTTESFAEKTKRMEKGPPPRDPTLQHPHCVYQILRRHYAAYTPDMVERTTGCPRDVFVKVAEALARNSGRERTGTICYAVGWDPSYDRRPDDPGRRNHSGPARQCRPPRRRHPGITRPLQHPRQHGYSDLIQHAADLPAATERIQGAHDIEGISRARADPDRMVAQFSEIRGQPFEGVLRRCRPSGHDLGFGWVPRIVGDHSQLPMTLAMRDGVIRGMFMLGQNPAVGGHNAALVHRGLAELDWLVVRDMTETETASFWYAGRPVRDGELHPRDIRTEVFLMPASLSAEKAGSVTNTHRLLQWHAITVARQSGQRAG